MDAHRLTCRFNGLEGFDYFSDMLMVIVEMEQHVRVVVIDHQGTILYAGRNTTQDYKKPLIVIETKEDRYRYVKSKEHFEGIRFKCHRCWEQVFDLTDHKCL